MSQRLVILTEIISPYRIPLFNALAGRPEIDVEVIFLAETDPDLRHWKIYKEEIRFKYRVLPSWRKRIRGYNVLLNSGLGAALRSAMPDAILCGGYNYLASWQALLWARTCNVPFLLWSESNLQDLRGGHVALEFAKDEFLQRCEGFVVPGTSARQYLVMRKIKEKFIFTAPNAVDNQFFLNAAARSRSDAVRIRRELQLPDRYFLFAGRLVREKGVVDLLSAYAKLNDSLRKELSLVFVGDGQARHELEEQAASISPGMIRFAGFAQREVLAAYYALAEMLILPTYTDTWGLVVNEAMACGLPVILSRAAGCATDLVTDNFNGLLVVPKDRSALACAMNRLAQQPELAKAMGARSFERIAQYSPQEWSKGIVRAVENIKGARD